MGHVIMMHTFQKDQELQMNGVSIVYVSLFDWYILEMVYFAIKSEWKKDS